jgi:hypothetical protein
MNHRIGGTGRLARTRNAIMLAAVLTLVDLAPSPSHALAGPAVDLREMLPEFTQICADLARAREELRLGALSEDSFASRVLDLFVCADSLQVLIQSADPSTRRFGGPLFAMERGLRYLIDSLRDNYVGIVARNGVSFVDADQALRAAVAWKSGVSAGGVDKVAVLRP